MTTKEPYFAIKLKTGETIFAEIVGSNDTHINLSAPIQVKFEPTDKSGESMFATEWMPYVEQEIYSIPLGIVYFVGYLNKKFIRFYGSVVTQTEINKIKQEVVEILTNKNDYPTMLNGVERMKERVNELKQKYSLEDDIIDFSEFEKALEKHKATMILH